MSMFVGAEFTHRPSTADMACVECHADLDPAKRRHSTRKDLELVDCSGCHRPEANAHKRSLHGVAAKDGDPLAPTCADCHGKHDILSKSDHNSPTAVMNVPLLCGACHQDGSPVSRTHEISQENILENYSMSIHGEGLFGRASPYCRLYLLSHGPRHSFRTPTSDQVSTQIMWPRPVLRVMARSNACTVK